jgi:hypothetical protein
MTVVFGTDDLKYESKDKPLEDIEIGDIACSQVIPHRANNIVFINLQGFKCLKHRWLDAVGKVWFGADFMKVHPVEAVPALIAQQKLYVEKCRARGIEPAFVI